MEKPKIEKNIPLATSKWDWLYELEVGDSFVVPSKFRNNVVNEMYRRKMIPKSQRIGDKISRQNQNPDDWKHRIWFAGRSSSDGQSS